MTRGRVRQPGDRHAVRVPGGAGQRHLGRRARHARHLGGRAAHAGAAGRCPRLLRPATEVAERGLHRRRRRSASRSPTTRPRSRSSPRRSALYLPGGAAAGGRLDVPQPRSGATPTGVIARQGIDVLLPGPDRPRHRRARCSTRRSPPTRGAVGVPDPPGRDDARRPRPLRRALPRADPVRYRGSTSTAWRRRPAAAPRSARRSTSSSSSTCPSMTRGPRRCTTTWRPARSPSPTATATSATTPRAGCSTSCSATGSPPSGPA